jgi:hypothetical protein
MGARKHLHRPWLSQAIPLPTGFDVRRFPSLYGYQTALFALQNRASLHVDGEVIFMLPCII